MKNDNQISRRKLLCSGAAIASTSLLSNTAWARAQATLAAAQTANTSTPRERLLFDFDWRFQFGHGSDPLRDFGFGKDQSDFSKNGDFNLSKIKFDDSKWRSLQLPHDWAVELPFVHDEAQQSHGYKPIGRRYPETSVGWYRKTFEIPQTDLGRRLHIEFDGAFRSVLVWLNGCFIGRNDNGYAPFDFDVTDFLRYGEKNVIAIRIDAAFGDGWFYEGAGIYRHVWLSKFAPLHITKWESTARALLTGGGAQINLATLIANEGATQATARVHWEILDPKGNSVGAQQNALQKIDPDNYANFNTTIKIATAELWSVDSPKLYTAIVQVESDGKLHDEERFTFGIRSVIFTADKGLFLNNQPIKIQGTCNHQDHAGVGAALPDRLQYYRMSVLKEMGSNAVRTSHNIPTQEWVDAADRMGMMMMCETRFMSSSSEGLAQLETMIKRYRNSPSIILWSIGNEEWILQGEEAEIGKRIAATMVRRVHELDPTRVVSAAVNGDNKQGLSDSLDIIGFNYNLKFPDEYHLLHPNIPVYGSETASAINTRGVYSTDALRNTLSEYDVNAVPWGETAEGWWKYYSARQWLAGGFAWTGFDYRGEPTPYGWPSINSQFGIIDMCGYPKDSYYYYKSWWGKDPVLHLFPHWNFSGREGEFIPVWVHSNLDEVELFLNGQSLGAQKVQALGHLEWQVKFVPGKIEARGKKNGMVILIEKRETTGLPASIRLTADRNEIHANGEDIAILKVEVLDKNGRQVPTAQNKIAFKVEGAGALIGVGNGDPNCQESDKEPHRSLFNGLAQVILQATHEPGEIHIEAVKDGFDGDELTPAKLIIRTTAAKSRAV